MLIKGEKNTFVIGGNIRKYFEGLKTVAAACCS